MSDDDHRQSACLITAAGLQESPAVKVTPSLFFLPLFSTFCAVYIFIIFPCPYTLFISLSPNSALLLFCIISFCVHLPLLWGFCAFVCVAGCVCVCVRSWSPAAVCTPDSAQLLLHSGGGLEVSDHTGLSAPHHWLLSWPPDPTEWLHWRLLRPAAPQWLGQVENSLHMGISMSCPVIVVSTENGGKLINFLTIFQFKQIL